MVLKANPLSVLESRNSICVLPPARRGFLSKWIIFFRHFL
jgi:hypothetical protein